MAIATFDDYTYGIEIEGVLPAADMGRLLLALQQAGINIYHEAYSKLIPHIIFHKMIGKLHQIIPYI